MKYQRAKDWDEFKKINKLEELSLRPDTSDNTAEKEESTQCDLVYGLSYFQQEIIVCFLFHFIYDSFFFKFFSFTNDL